MSNLQPSPSDPGLFEEAVLKYLVKYPMEYDWDALAVLTPTWDKLLRFYRTVLKGLELRIDRQTRSERELLQLRSFRPDLRFVSRLAAELGITNNQRSKFAFFAGIVLTWQDDSSFAKDDGYSETGSIREAKAIWAKLLKQRVPLAYLREVADISQKMRPDHFERFLFAHSVGMNEWDAASYLHPNYHSLFTKAQIRSIAHHKLSLDDVKLIFTAGRENGTHPTVNEVVAAKNAGMPNSYLIPVLATGQTVHAATAMWKAGFPVEYATA